MKQDQFLHDFRRQPDQQFTDTLYQQIKDMPSTTPSLAKEPPSHLRPLAQAVAFALVFALLFALLMPSVRATVQETIQQIGQLTFRATDQYPGVDNPLIVPNDILPLAEARERLSVDFSLPQNIPSNWSINDSAVNVLNVREGLFIDWFSAESGNLMMTLYVYPASPEVNLIVGPESVTELQINGQPASLVRGIWNADTQSWDNPDYRTLRWTVDAVEYALTIPTATATDAEMIAIAESVPPTE